MKPLDDEQRARAEAHADVAIDAAAMYRAPPLDFHERVSAAGLGLVRAAGRWTPGDAEFRTYAIRAALRAIHRDRRARLRRPTSGLAAPEAVPGRGDDPGDEAAAREELARLADALGALTARQRRVLDRYLAGERWADIARELGLHRQSVERLRARAVGRLRDALGDGRD